MPGVILLLVMVLSAPFLIITPAHSQNTGELREALNRKNLIACAAPNNLPFSNDKSEGFENRIAQLVADDLNVPLKYRWYPQSVGFVRRTLNLRECDLVLGMPVGNERVQNTNSYYHSAYVMVYRAHSDITATTVEDPQLRRKTLGVVAGTPPATLLARYDLLGQVRAFHRTVDTRHFNPAADAIAAVAKGELDVAFIWGPIAGYFAAQQSVPLKVIPLINENPAVRLKFRISMAVRFREPEWKRLINRTLTRLKPEINAILRDYNIPLLDDKGQLLLAAVVREPVGYKMDNYRSKVPATLAGVKVVNSVQVKKLLDAGSVILIDVLPSPPKPKSLKTGAMWMPLEREKIPNTHWLANVGFGAISDRLNSYFRSNLKRLTKGNKAHPVLIYCRADCWMSWNAAKRAQTEYGYTNIYWFPQGVDGWQQQNYPTEGQHPIPMDENQR